MNKGLKWFIIIITTITILIPELLLGYFFLESGIIFKSNIEENINLDINLDGGVSVRFSPMDDNIIDSIQVEAIELDEPMPKGLNIISYSFSAINDLTTPAELRIPFNKSLIKDGEKVKDCVLAARYDFDKREYAPIRYYIDEEKAELVIFDDHLGRFDVFVYSTVRDKNTSLNLRLYKAVSKFDMDSLKYQNVIEQVIKNNGKSLEDLNPIAINILIEYMGANKNIYRMLESSLDEPVSKALEDSHKTINDISVLLAMYELADDIRTGNYGAVGLAQLIKMQDLYYNDYSYSISKLSSLAVLNEIFSESDLKKNTLNEDEEAYEKAYEKAYKLYYKKKYKNTEINTYFYNKILRAYNENVRDIGDKSEFEVLLNNILDDYSREFWYEEETIEKYYKIANRKDVSKDSDFSDKAKDKISENARINLIKELKPVVDSLKIHISNDMYNDIAVKYDFLDKILSEKVVINISEKNLKNKSLAFKQGKFFIKPLAAETNKKSWQGSFDKNANANLEFSVYKYLLSGAPNKIELYKKDTDSDLYPPDKIWDFKIDDFETKILFEPDIHEIVEIENKKEDKGIKIDDLVGNFEGSVKLDYAEISPKASPLFKTRIDGDSISDKNQNIKIKIIKLDKSSGIMNFENFYITSPMDGSKLYTGINQIKFRIKNSEIIFDDRLSDSRNSDMQWEGELNGKALLSSEYGRIAINGELVFEGEMKIYGVDNNIKYGAKIDLKK